MYPGWTLSALPHSTQDGYQALCHTVLRMGTEHSVLRINTQNKYQTLLYTELMTDMSLKSPFQMFMVQAGWIPNQILI